MAYIEILIIHKPHFLLIGLVGNYKSIKLLDKKTGNKFYNIVKG